MTDHIRFLREALALDYQGTAEPLISDLPRLILKNYRSGVNGFPEPRLFIPTLK